MSLHLSIDVVFDMVGSFRKRRIIGPLHTGGPIVVTSDAKRVVTCLGEQALLTNVENGQEVCRFYNVRIILKQRYLIFNIRCRIQQL